MTTYPVIIPTVWDPSRQIINDFLNQIIAGFQAAVPNVIRKQWSEIPQSLTGETPMIYLGDIEEVIQYSGGTQYDPSLNGAGLRQTTFNGVIGYVDTAPDNQEANTRANSFADYMREVFWVNARIYSTGIFRQTGLRDGVPIEQGPSLKAFQHLQLDFTFEILEGRE